MYAEHTNLRQQWASVNDWIPECTTCRQQEQSGRYSFRKSSFDIIPDDIPDGPVALDIQLDYNCNAACIICGPHASTTWSQQLKKTSTTIYFQTNGLMHLTEIFSNIDLSLVRRIKFFGGEPLLTDTHVNILNLLPKPELVEIWYTSNGSIVPTDEVLMLWSKFKLVYLEASVDGINERFKYIRWPLAWEKVSNNLYELRDKAPNNVLFRLNHTLNPFNIFYYNELEEWVNNNFSTNKTGDRTEINVHPCWDVWDLSRTPLSLRDEIYKKYSSDHANSILLKNLPLSPLTPIMEFTKKWDIIRNNDWRLVFPEIVDYFK